MKVSDVLGNSTKDVVMLTNKATVQGCSGNCHNNSIDSNSQPDTHMSLPHIAYIHMCIHKPLCTYT